MLECSVIIPSKGRQKLVERAVESVLASKGSHLVEIIVVDDNSNPPLAIGNLRPQDKIIFLDKSSGAAIARNNGIAASVGKLIYLLDSDDYFLERDFERDLQSVGDNAIYYTDIFSGSKSSYPLEIDVNDFLRFVFFKYPHICQTSSLCFLKANNIFFDESLPKHQDWDFVYSSLQKGFRVKKIEGLTCFDTSDKKSLSRQYNSEKSKVWFSKLVNNQENLSVNISVVEFHLFSKYLKEMSWLRFFVLGARLMLSRDTSARFFVRAFAHRMLQFI